MHRSLAFSDFPCIGSYDRSLAHSMVTFTFIAGLVRLPLVESPHHFPCCEFILLPFLHFSGRAHVAKLTVGSIRTTICILPKESTRFAGTQAVLSRTQAQETQAVREADGRLCIGSTRLTIFL